MINQVMINQKKNQKKKINNNNNNDYLVLEPEIEPEEVGLRFFKLFN